MGVLNEESPSYDELSPSRESLGRLQSNDADSEIRESTHAIACINCSTRKVKCDRAGPSCSNCLRANVTCEYRAPLPRGPRKRKYPPEDDLQARLERYEDLLRACGIPDPAHATSVPLRSNMSPPWAQGVHINGKIVTNEQGKPRYIESKLWHAVAEEMPHDGDEDDEEDQVSLMTGFTPGSTVTSQSQGKWEGALLLGSYAHTPSDSAYIDPKSQYLTHDQTMAMIQAFRSNVHPLTKFVHLPTLTPRIEAAVANPSATTRKMDALIFSMMFCTASSLDDAECQEIFFTDRASICSSLQDTTTQALIAADILRADDIEVLQAFVFFMQAMRDRTDLRTLWMLTGTALRIAMATGIHRGGDFEKFFTPFEVQYRRRLWWQIAFLDTRIGDLAGFGASPVAIGADASSPANYNDDDLQPDMKELPPPRTGATEMLFIVCRDECRKYGKAKGLGPLFAGIARSETSIAEWEKRIQGMEGLLEQNILRYCDPLVPLHIMISATVRTIIHRLRLRAHHPLSSKDAEDARPLGEKEREVCFNSALKTIEYDNHMFGAPSLRGFRWFLRAHFQWDALIFLLSELRRRGYSADAVNAWKQLETCFSNHPEFLDDLKKPLHLAVSNLCLKAWAAREAAQVPSCPTGTPPQPPRFIEVLREKHAKRKIHSPSMSSKDGSLDMGAPLFNQPDFAEFANASLDPNFFGQGVGNNLSGQMDWSLWNETLQFSDSSMQGFSWMK